MKHWTTDNIPSQKGKVFLVTGANSGTGFEASRVLAQKGAKVVMAVRNWDKGTLAKEKIHKEMPSADIELMHLNLADLISIEKFSVEFTNNHKQLDVLINNAGIALPNEREETEQKFEAHFGTNHLGHFALTGRLLPILKNTHNSRIVTVASFVPNHSGSVIRWEDLQHKNAFDGMVAYGQSKLANIMFALSLEDMLKGSSISILSVLANPGFTRSGIQKGMGIMARIWTRILAQEVGMGVLPILRAATDLAVKGGEFYSPLKMKEMRGYPELTQSPENALLTEDRQRLWKISEEMTLIHYNFD